MWSSSSSWLLLWMPGMFLYHRRGPGRACSTEAATWSAAPRIAFYFLSSVNTNGYTSWASCHGVLLVLWGAVFIIAGYADRNFGAVLVVLVSSVGRRPVRCLASGSAIVDHVFSSSNSKLCNSSTSIHSTTQPHRQMPFISCNVLSQSQPRQGGVPPGHPPR